MIAVFAGRPTPIRPCPASRRGTSSLACPSVWVGQARLLVPRGYPASVGPAVEIDADERPLVVFQRRAADLVAGAEGERRAALQPTARHEKAEHRLELARL